MANYEIVKETDSKGREFVKVVFTEKKESKKINPKINDDSQE